MALKSLYSFYVASLILAVISVSLDVIAWLLTSECFVGFGLGALIVGTAVGVRIWYERYIKHRSLLRCDQNSCDPSTQLFRLSCILIVFMVLGLVFPIIYASLHIWMWSSKPN